MTSLEIGIYPNTAFFASSKLAFLHVFPIIELQVSAYVDPNLLLDLAIARFWAPLPAQSGARFITGS